MASRRLRNRSLCVVSQADSDHSENMDGSDVTCFESDAEVTVTENSQNKMQILSLRAMIT